MAIKEIRSQIKFDFVGFRTSSGIPVSDNMDNSGIIKLVYKV